MNGIQSHPEYFFMLRMVPLLQETVVHHWISSAIATNQVGKREISIAVVLKKISFPSTLFGPIFNPRFLIIKIYK
jgi:hypothetical protein